MKNKTLIFLCDNYPLSQKEPFIDDEIQIITNRFEKIIVVIKEQQRASLNSFIPENMQIVTYSEIITFWDKIKSIPFIFKIFFIHEIILAIKDYKLKPTFILFKIMFMDLVRALKLKKIIKQVKKQYNISDNKVMYYSYWHNYKSLTLALLKKENKDLKCIARAHGWDVFYNRHNPPYLPFKKFIVSNLDQTYSASMAGKNEFIKLLGEKIENKIAVSHLGKINNRIPNITKISDELLICSCSNLILLKRVNLIIEIFKKLSFKNIKWVHFGDGYLRNELEQSAKVNLKNIDFCFKDIVPNSEILDFYNQNYVDLFINVSESEGIPVSIMEALSAGIPVIATNVGGTNEIVNNDVGFLIDKEFEINTAVNIINNYLNSPIENQKEYRLRAYNYWKENYNAEKNYTDFVNQILLL